MSAERGFLETIRHDAWALFGGWVNTQTGRGDPERDKGAANAWVGSIPIPAEELSSLFASNSLVRAICMALPEWGLRNGWNLTLDADAVESKAVSVGCNDYLDNRGAHESFLRSAVWGQTFGGGLMLIGADDGRKTKEPLVEEEIKSIRFFRVVPRHLVQIADVYDSAEHEKFGSPASYLVRERAAGVTATEPVIWHESRVVRLPGPMTDDEWQVQNEGWDQSIIDVVVQAVSKHDSMWDNVGAAVEDASQGVWKIKNLAKAAATGLMKEIEARFKLADMTRSRFRSLLLDADAESFEYVHREFGGLSELLSASTVRTAGAAQIPATVLMGQSPAGLNATGESDLELWYARVRAYQKNVLLSRWRRVVRLVFLAKDGPTGGELPKAWAVAFADPRSLSPMQRAEMRARQSQVDTAAITNRVLTPEEVAINRYTPEGWSDVTTVDLGWRRRVVQRLSERIADKGAEGAGLLETLVDRWLTVSAPGPTPGPAPEPVDPPSGKAAPNNRVTGAA